MGMWIGRNRKARVTYGFDEIALVPGELTINPNEVDTTFQIPRRDAPPIRLNAKDTPVPYHPNLWGTHRPTAQTIAVKVRELLRL